MNVPFDGAILSEAKELSSIARAAPERAALRPGMVAPPRVRKRTCSKPIGLQSPQASRDGREVLRFAQDDMGRRGRCAARGNIGSRITQRRRGASAPLVVRAAATILPPDWKKTTTRTK